LKVVNNNENVNQFIGLLVTSLENKDSIDSFIIIYYGGNIRFKKWNDFGVGLNFSLVLQKNISNKNKISFMFVKDNGFCYNNDENNKDAYIKVCDLEEKKTKYVLNYIFGYLPNHIDDYETIKISPCSNENVISGSYDMGSNPLIQSYLVCKEENCRFAFMEMHQGITEKMDIETKCGVSKFHDGLVIDGWNIPEF
jgi:hypothetical protein